MISRASKRPSSIGTGAGLLEEQPHVLQQIHKRLRNLQKRLRGIDEIEAKRDAGKELNSDQVCCGESSISNF